VQEREKEKERANNLGRLRVASEPEEPRSPGGIQIDAVYLNSFKKGLTMVFSN
jgi:hypothetical protein